MKIVIFFGLVLACLVHRTSAIRDLSDGPSIDVTSRVNHIKSKLPRIYHCCADEQFLDISEGIHVHGELLSVPKCVDSHGSFQSNISIHCSKYLNFGAELDLADLPEWEFYVENGMVIVGDHKTVRMITSPRLVCFGNSTEANDQTGSGFKLIAMTCYYSITEEEEKVGADVETSGKLSIVSIPFVVLTIIVYSLLPELRDLQGLSVISLCSSYTIALIMNANTALNNNFSTDSEMCHAGGLILYYSKMSSYFWMNVKSIQALVSIGFPKLAVPWRRQFSWYCGYAWGVPAILLICVMIAEVTPGTHVIPNIGIFTNCWFDGSTAQWAYYLGPMTVVFSSSALMYAAAAYIIFRDTSGAEYKTLMYKFLLSLRLFIVVGITWLLEPIERAIGKQHTIWIMADCWNMLQGVFIFIVLVLFRKRAVQGLVERGYTFCLKSWLQTLVDRLSGDEQPIILNENGELEANELKDNVQQDIEPEI